MTKQIQFFDTTLRDGEQTIGVNFSVEQKVEIAKELERWGVDVIEAGFPVASPEDFEAVQAVSRAVKRTRVTGLARAKAISTPASKQQRMPHTNRSMSLLQQVLFTVNQSFI